MTETNSSIQVLFICKKNEIYGSPLTARPGLYNSASYVASALVEVGISAEVVVVNDNNDIDKEVYERNPRIVVIEALWVVPEKFDVLKNLHPNVKWFIHLHSHAPFLALEGIALSWIYGYWSRKIPVIVNSLHALCALRAWASNQGISKDLLLYLPNVYSAQVSVSRPPQNKIFLDIGCFGAVRPMKNHLIQALSAIRFAKEQRKKMRFHINATRSETYGDPVLKNLVNLFSDNRSPGCELVQHQWYESAEFGIILDQIDLSMQVSLTETFSMVTADAVSRGVPVVVSDQVHWVSRLSQAKTDSVDSIVRKMHLAFQCKSICKWNQFLLQRHHQQAVVAWSKFVQEQLS